NLLYDYSPARTYYLFKRGVGATSLASSWNPFNAIGGENNTLDATMGLLTSLKALSIPVNFKCLIWVQGEADNGNATASAAYYQNLKNFIAFMRGIVVNPRMPFVCVGVNPQSSGFGTYGSVVRKAMIDVCEEVDDCYFIDPSGVPFSSA